MYNFAINRKEKDEILDNVAFTKRQRDIFLKLVEGLKNTQIPKYVNCSLRTVQYEIKRIEKKIDDYKNEQAETSYFVYVHIFPNGKKYVGMTDYVPKRWGNCGLPYASNIKMYEDIIQYGWENIQHEIILETQHRYKAKQLESKLIQIFDLTNDKNGYNKRL